MKQSLYIYNLTNIKVIDGDTIKADIDLGFNNFIHNKTIRFDGINSPELKSTIRGIINPDKEKGLASKLFVEKCLLNNPCVIFHSKEKVDSFGRSIGIIYYLDSNNQFINLNNQLVSQNLSVKKSY